MGDCEIVNCGIWPCGNFAIGNSPILQSAIDVSLSRFLHPFFMQPSSRIYVAGHRGMAGSAISRNLTAKGFSNLITRTSSELVLRNQQAVADFFAKEKPEYVF